MTISLKISFLIGSIRKCVLVWRGRDLFNIIIEFDLSIQQITVYTHIAH